MRGLLCHSLACSLLGWLAGDWQEELELWWELVFGVESVGEVDSSDSAVSVDLHSKDGNILALAFEFIDI